MSELISIVVPVYNVEAYLDRCVQSIVDQTYRNIEIILVDDGSPDNCGHMCDAWAAKDDRIKVIHKKNGGLSDARNAGLDVASGEYIGFVDSDDWIEPQMYQKMYEAMITSDSDIVSCGARRVWLDGKPSQELFAENRNRVLKQEEAMEALVTGKGLFQIPWDKLYRRTVMEGVLFLVGLIHEDEFWTWQVIARAKRVAILRDSYYNYLQRGDSTMGAGFSEKSLLVMRAKTQRQDYIEEFMPQLTNVGRLDLAYTGMYLGTRVLKTMDGKTAVEHMRQLKETVKRYPINEDYLRELPWKKRLHLRMIQHFFMPVCWIHSKRENE